MGLELPPPAMLGLPPKFTSWRPEQERAVAVAMESPERFIAQAAPTGFGKSLAYMTSALLAGGRCAIITSTKGLQKQLTSDFQTLGLSDIRGMNAFPCLAGQHYSMPNATCAEAPCHAGAPCSLRDDGCHYYDAYRAATVSKLVVTNYAYWMHIHRYGEGLGEFNLLILDEAHDAPDAISNFVSVDIDCADLGSILDDARTPDTREPIAHWSEWAADRAYRCELILESLQDRMRRALTEHGPTPQLTHNIMRVKRLQRKLESIALAQGAWVVERDKQLQRIVKLTPVWASEYAERYLFRAIPKVVLYSATLRPKTAQLLGIKEMSFNEYQSSFPVERRPVYRIPTVSVRFDSDDDELRVWLNRIDQIIRQRQDRKGIIHSVSFARRDLIVKNSEFRHIMLWNSGENTAQVVEKFKNMQSPCVLVSPSVMTGYDFPYSQCEYQIVAKMPFPDYTSPLSKARDRADPEWGRYAAMQVLVQATGRGMRAEDDRCETLIVDDNASWMVRRCKQYVPAWWLDAYRESATIPPPPHKLLK